MSAWEVEPTQPQGTQSNSYDGILRNDKRGQQWLRPDRSAAMAITGGNGNVSWNAATVQEYHNISLRQKMMSATWGSILTSILVTPLDVVRVRLQSQTPVIRASASISPSTAFKELPPNLGVTACCREVFWVGDNAQFCMVGQSVSAAGELPGGTIAADCVVEDTQRKTFTSTFDGLRKIARNEGALSLWRGLSPTLVMAIPANVIYFTGYDWLRFDGRSPIYRYVNDRYAPFVSGTVARIAAASVISPIEMFRTRLQAMSGTGADHFKATLRGLHQMTQTQGYSSLWRGLTLTMWRDVPFSGLYWWGYETVRNALTDMRERLSHSQGAPVSGRPQSAHDHQRLHSRLASQSHQNNAVTFMDSFFAGAVSGAVAALITTPFDVGKTRQQVFRHHGDEHNIPLSARAGTSGAFTSSSFAKLVPPPSTPSSPASPRHPLRPEQLSIPRFLLHIFREEGLSGLFRGWAARCLKVAPACAIMISSYEVGKKMAGRVNERRGLAGNDP